MTDIFNTNIDTFRALNIEKGYEMATMMQCMTIMNLNINTDLVSRERIIKAMEHLEKTTDT